MEEPLAESKGNWRTRTTGERALLERILNWPNPFLDGNTHVPECYVLPSSEPECICPDMAIDRNCSRHEFMWDWVGQDPFKDHIDLDALASAQAGRIGGPSFASAGVPETLWPTPSRRWADSIQSQWRQEYDAVLKFVVNETGMPALALPVDDVLLSYESVYGYRVIKAYVPPKYTLRQRFRGWRRRTNHTVQQWIHDHLTEAYCDC